MLDGTLTQCLLGSISTRVCLGVKQRPEKNLSRGYPCRDRGPCPEDRALPCASGGGGGASDSDLACWPPLSHRRHCPTLKRVACCRRRALRVGSASGGGSVLGRFHWVLFEGGKAASAGSNTLKRAQVKTGSQTSEGPFSAAQTRYPWYVCCCRHCRPAALLPAAMSRGLACALVVVALCLIAGGLVMHCGGQCSCGVGWGGVGCMSIWDGWQPALVQLCSAGASRRQLTPRGGPLSCTSRRRRRRLPFRLRSLPRPPVGETGSSRAGGTDACTAVAPAVCQAGGGMPTR